MNRKVASSIILTIFVVAMFLVSPAAFLVKADGQSVSAVSNIAVGNVTTAQSFVEEGFQTNVTATVQNTGAATNTFNLTFYANDIALNTQEITLPEQSSTNASFLWDTTGFALGNWSLSASAWAVSDQTPSIYNNSTSSNSTVLVTCLGDLTGHSQVDSNDFFAFINAYVNYNSLHEYNPAADFDHDDVINANDFFSFVDAYISYWTGPTPFINKGLTLTMTIPKTTYPLSEPVNFTLSINNVSNRTISFANRYGLFDFIVYNDTAILYRNSLNMLMSPQWIQVMSLPPGGSYSQNMQWEQDCNINIKFSSGGLSPVFLAQPGTYYIVGQALGMQTLPQKITIT